MTTAMAMPVIVWMVLGRHHGFGEPQAARHMTMRATVRVGVNQVAVTVPAGLGGCVHADQARR